MTFGKEEKGMSAFDWFLEILYSAVICTLLLFMFILSFIGTTCLMAAVYLGLAT